MVTTFYRNRFGLLGPFQIIIVCPEIEQEQAQDRKTHFYLRKSCWLLRQFSGQPPDWKSSWRDFSEVRGGFGGKFPEGGLNFLEVALVWKFPYGNLPKQSSKKFASEPPKLLRSPSRSGPMRKLVAELS